MTTIHKHLCRPSKAYSLCRILPAGVLWCITCATITTACQQSEWDDHYAPQTEASGTLLDVMTADGRFSRFLESADQAGQTALLTGTQTYTVWAPTDDVLQAAATSSALNVANHISRFIYGIEDLVDTTTLRIKMLSGKYVDFTHDARSSSSYSIGDALLKESSLLASNGVVHSIGDIIPLRQNLYEKIQDDPRFSQLAAYLTAFDEREFDGSKSISIGQNDYGQTVYDSVFNYSNYWMKHHGSIYDEDSTYTMLLPTNQAWTEGEGLVKPCFRTFGKMLTDDSNSGRSLIATRTYALDTDEADSLQRVHTQQAMAGSLVFRRVVNPVENDSLITTTGQVIHTPQSMFDNASPEPTSNGLAMVTDSWTVPATDTWNRTLRIEAETAVHKQLYTTTPTTRDATTEGFVGVVSGNAWLEVENASTSARMQPQILFDLPGTLATTYNIYVVMAPGLAHDATHQGDSTRVRFYLNYVHEDGTMHEDDVIEADPLTGMPFVTNGRAMTRFLIAHHFRFPYANVNMSEDEELPTTSQEPAVKLRMQTNVAASETTLMNKVMRIDCFILEPVTAE